LHSFEYCPPTAEEIGAWGVSARRTYANDDVARWAVTAPSRLVVNSGFLADRMHERHHVAAAVVHPAIERPELPARARRDSYVSGICGHRYKGAEVFLALADAFPRERFLLIGDVDPALASVFAARRNVRRLGRASVGRFLTISRVVLVPSRWPEPFGRIAVEAMACGIPTLVSRTGGLAQIVGPSELGVDAFRDPAAWVQALERLLGSPDLRAEQGALGRRLADPFVQGDSTRALAEMVVELARDAAPELDGRMLALCGGTTRATAYSMVNVRWMSALAGQGGLRVVDVETAAELGRAVPD